MKQSRTLTKITTKHEVGIEKSIHHLGLNYFLIGVIKQPICPPTMMTILMLWNIKFNYYKEQHLESTMGKYKFEVASFSITKRMKSKTNDIDAEIQPTMLNQIHFPMCMYIMMWVAKYEEHAWMVKTRINDFCWFDRNTVDLPAIKEIICNFQVYNAGSILHGK
jgi:hypothetical protein